MNLLSNNTVVVLFYNVTLNTMHCILLVVLLSGPFLSSPVEVCLELSGLLSPTHVVLFLIKYTLDVLITRINREIWCNDK